MRRLALIADEHPGGVGETDRDFVGRRKHLDASQTKSSMLDPVAFSEAARHAIGFVWFRSGLMHDVVPTLPDSLGRTLGLAGFLYGGFCQRFRGSIVMVAPAGIALHPSGFRACHRYDRMGQYDLAFGAICIGVRSNRDLGHEFSSNSPG